MSDLCGARFGSPQLLPATVTSTLNLHLEGVVRFAIKVVFEKITLQRECANTSSTVLHIIEFGNQQPLSTIDLQLRLPRTLVTDMASSLSYCHTVRNT